jgi:hypothetical protein
MFRPSKLAIKLEIENNVSNLQRKGRNNRFALAAKRRLENPNPNMTTLGHGRVTFSRMETDPTTT